MFSFQLLLLSVTPVLNIIQTFLNEAALYDTILQLPTTMNLLGAIISFAMNPKFKYLEENIKTIRERLPEYTELIGDEFDIKKVWSGKLSQKFVFFFYFDPSKHFIPRVSRK